jgi:hypothetical protein
MNRLLNAFERRPLLCDALALFAVVALVYLASIDIRASRGASITGDEPFYLLTTQSLIDDGDLDLTNQYEQRSYEEFFDHPSGLWKQSVPNEDGELLSPHNPGLSLYLIPGFALGGLTGVQVQLLLTAALTFALAYVLTARLTGARLVPWLAALAVGLTASAFIYSTEVYPEVPAAGLLVASLLVLLPLDKRPGWSEGLVLAALLSAMVWLGVKYAPLAAMVTALYVWRADNTGRLALVVVGVTSAAFFAWWHLHTFGELTPYSVNSVYAGDSTGQVLDSHLALETDRIYRLWGVFIDRRFGIARWAPLLLLALPGFALLLRRDVMTRTVVALVGAQLLMSAFVWITIMGWWFPGRTMMPVLPLFAVPLAVLVLERRRWAAPAALILGAYSLLVTACLAYAGHRGEITIAVDPFDMDAVPFTAVSRLFPQYTSWRMETQLLNAAWLAVGCVLLGSFAARALLPVGARTWLRQRLPARRRAAVPESTG